MMEDDFAQLAAGLTLSAPASISDIEQVQSELAVGLPDDYVAFMLRSNGAIGPVGETGYVNLWPINELAELNQEYRAGEFAPGLLLFGSDGGGEAFAFDRRNSAMPIVGVPFVGMSLNEVRPIAPTFAEFLKGNW
jgi:hypothetical protein